MADSSHSRLKGHRARLRARLFESGDDALLDHEIIEYLLTLSIRQGDTKDLAKRLIERHGGFGRLLRADADALKREGLGDTTVAALKIAEVAARRLLATEMEERDVLSNWEALTDYLQASMAHGTIEEVRVIFLNAKNRVIANEAMWSGSIDESAVHVREVIARAITLGAAAIILVHNHPSGDPTPSPADIRITRDLAEAARHMKISLHDHVIVGTKGQKSLRAEGLL